jgi:ketosteroid isomerase-like protein
MGNPNIDLAVGYYEALNRRDFTFYDGVFTDDVVFEAVGGVSGSGKETVTFFDRIWTTAFSDFHIAGTYHLGDGDRVVCHNRATGTHDGTLVMPDGGEVPPTGRTLDAPFFASFEVRDGRLCHEHIYFDRMLLAEQLGLLPAHA